MSCAYDGNGERVLKSNTSTGVAVKRYWSMGGGNTGDARPVLQPVFPLVRYCPILARL